MRTIAFALLAALTAVYSPSASAAEPGYKEFKGAGVFSTDSSMVLIYDPAAGTGQIIDTQTEKEIRPFQFAEPLANKPGDIYFHEGKVKVTYNPYDPKKRKELIFDVKTGQWETVDMVVRNLGTGIPDTDYAAKMETAKKLYGMKPDEHVHFSDDDRLAFVIRSANSSGTTEYTRIVDAKSGKELYNITGERVGSLPNNRLAASDLKDIAPTTRILDAQTGKELYKIKNAHVAYPSADGTKLVAANLALQDARILEADTGKELCRITNTVQVCFGTSIRIPPDGKTAIALNAENATARLIDIASGKELLNIRIASTETSPVRITPDGKKIWASDPAVVVDVKTRRWEIDALRKALK